MMTLSARIAKLRKENKMHNLIYILLGLVCLVALVSVIWRLLSQQFTIPCPTWLGWLVELDNPLSREHKAAIIVKNLELKPGMTVLDVGCGPGRVTIPVAQALGEHGTVVAMDMQKGMLQKVKAKAEAQQLKNITYLEAAIGAGFLTPDTFDRVLLVAVLGEIVDQQVALKEIFDALKPGGILSVTETVFDPHYQRRSNVLIAAQTVGFREAALFDDLFAFTMHLRKPAKL